MLTSLSLTWCDGGILLHVGDKHITLIFGTTIHFIDINCLLVTVLAEWSGVDIGHPVLTKI